MPRVPFSNSELSEKRISNTVYTVSKRLVIVEPFNSSKNEQRAPRIPSWLAKIPAMIIFGRGGIVALKWVSDFERKKMDD